MSRGAAQAGAGLVAIVLLVVAVASRDTPAADAVAWSPLPDGPLSAREPAAGLWTGEEVLVIGGSDAPPCPPNASCVAPTVPPLADGAAYDPATRSWRRIAEAPVGFEWAQPVLVGSTAYLWISGAPGRPEAPRAFLAYRIGEDRWDEFPVPSEDPDVDFSLLAAGDLVVAYRPTDEAEAGPDFVFDPAGPAWRELPPDPFSPGFDRVMAWDGREVVLVDHELTPNPGSEEEPLVTRAAALDLETRSWRVLGDVEGALATLAAAAEGFVLDRGLAELRPGPDDFTVAGFLDGPRAHYYGTTDGLVLDLRRETWLRMADLPEDGFRTGEAQVTAGRDRLVWGGAAWPERDPFAQGELRADGWIWTPPPG